MARMTVDQFEQMTNAPENDDRRFELLHGVVTELFPSPIGGWIVAQLCWHVVTYLK